MTEAPILFNNNVQYSTNLDKTKTMINGFVKEANVIYTDVRKRLKTDPAFKDLSFEDRLSYYQKNHAYFNTKFPIVMRYMIQLGLYHPKPFTRFLKLRDSLGWAGNDEKFCSSRAKYIKWLYAEKTNTHNEKQLKKIYTDTYESLMKEMTDMKNTRKKEHKKNEEDEKIFATERRDELKKMIQDIVDSRRTQQSDN